MTEDAATTEKKFTFGWFSRHKYKDLVFYVLNDDGQTNTGLIELPDTEENRALVMALSGKKDALNDILIECAKVRNCYPLMHRTLSEFDWFCRTCIWGWTQTDQFEMDKIFTEYPQYVALLTDAQKEKEGIQAKWGDAYQYGDDELIRFARAFLEYCHEQYDKYAGEI